jgi:hypothetical protein
LPLAVSIGQRAALWPWAIVARYCLASFLLEEPHAVFDTQLCLADALAHSSMQPARLTSIPSLNPMSHWSARSEDGVQADAVELQRGTNTTGEAPDAIRTWLDWLGLRFDPFLPLDAASDSRLSDYLVGHEAFATAWGDWTSFVFAPPGGGKTSLRVRTAQACSIGQETNRPFPVSYNPPFLLWGHTTPSFDDHLAAIARAGAKQLLLALALRPHWLFRLDEPSRRAVRSALEWNLPGPLGSYLDLCRQSHSLIPLREALDPTFVLSDPPDPSTLLRLCDALDAVPIEHPSRPTPAVRWDALRRLLLDIFEFPSVYILIDGLDAAPETAGDAQIVVACLSTLLSVSGDWAKQRVFFKGFLPSETQDILSTEFSHVYADAHVTTIHWTPILLAEVIRRRVYVASEGAFGSLDAIASPALRDVETALAQAIIPLPREMLVLTRHVLYEHVCHAGAVGKIDTRDVDMAVRWYADNRPHILVESPVRVP